MTTTHAALRELREEVSSESSRNIDFENALKALFENPCDENLDQINQVRANFVGSAAAIEDIIEKLQSLTWTLREPNADDLKSVADIVFIGRQLVRGSASIIHSYQPLWQKGVIITETNEFKEASEHLAEVLDDIQSVYFQLPNLPGFDDTTHELESL